MNRTAFLRPARNVVTARTRLVGGVACAATLVAFLLLPNAAEAAVPRVNAAAAASCTDSASTNIDITEYGTDIQLRTSPNCGGAAWFRLNGWNGTGSGTIRLQAKTGAGTIVNGPSAINQQSPFVSSYVTGYSEVRITFTNQSGAASNYTSPWVGVARAAIVQ